MTKKYKSKGIDLKPYLFWISAPLVILSICIGYKVYSTDKILIPVSVFALIAGLIFEYRRISDNWSMVLGTSLFSFIFSFFAFLPGKHETNYILENHIEMWPYVFLFFFIILAMGFSGKKIIAKLTIGITLLQSIAVIYWIIDLGFMNTNYIAVKILMLIGFCFAIFSIYNAFSYKVLSRTSRLILSIWSSIIMVFFAVDNIYKVYQNPQIENTHEIIQAVFIALQFFLLGISSIYIVQNAFMLIEFLPGKNRFFNEAYFKDVKNLKQQHISRYSTEHVTRWHSLICILFTGTVFGLNYYYRFLPRIVIIWLVFVLFPIALNLIDKPIEGILPTLANNASDERKGSR